MKRGISKYPQLAGLQGRAYQTAWEKLKREELSAQCRTVRGTVRKRRIPQPHPELCGLPTREYNRLRARIWRRQRRELPTVLEMLYHVERESMERIES